jgi:hypothetical protein
VITPAFALTATERVLPKLALDFTTAVLDSRVTFTRTTGASNPATFVNSSGVITAATNNQPRFDYNPVTLVCKGLLIEESRANLALQSQAINDAAWSKTNATVSADAVTSPDGTTNADALVDNSTNGQHRINNGVAITVTSGASYTFSFYAKQNTIRYVNARIITGTGNAQSTFDLQLGTVFGTSAGSATIAAAGNGWYRCTVTGTADGTSAFVYVNLNTSANVNPQSYIGTGSSAYIWGAQLEAGAFATSYIPTTTTALTRNADVATITGTNFSDFWQASKGGAQVQAIPSTVSGIRPLVQYDDGTADNLIALRGNAADPELQIVDGGAPQVQLDAGTIAANTDYNLAGWWQTNDCKARLDSGAVVTDTSATIPTVTQARLGSDGTNYLNGHLTSISYYDTFSQRIYTRRKNKAVFNLM